MKLTIPGQEPLKVANLVLDFNGTIAVDGEVYNEVRSKLKEMSNHLTIHVITADTNGTVEEQCRDLPVKVHIIGKEDQHLEKRDYVLQLQAEGVISIGNGRNDEEMFANSALSIAVIGSEGCSTAALLNSDLVVTNIVDALDLLLKEHRLIATLRR